MQASILEKIARMGKIYCLLVYLDIIMDFMMDSMMGIVKNCWDCALVMITSVESRLPELKCDE